MHWCRKESIIFFEKYVTSFKKQINILNGTKCVSDFLNTNNFNFYLTPLINKRNLFSKINLNILTSAFISTFPLKYAIFENQRELEEII